MIKLLFPFLIGRIRTERKVLKFYTEEEFPFLIGRIRTVPWSKGNKKDIEFPFLIGRIRTYEVCRKLQN